MTRPRHISLDFYGTLGTPSIRYAMERNQYLADLLKVPVYRVIEEYKNVKKELDKQAEQYGISKPVGICWHHFFARLKISPVYTQQVVQETERLFAMYPPTILDDTVAQINRLFDLGVTFSIGSNVNFIASRNIWRLVQKRRIPIEFGIFSDQVSCSKPHGNFFGEIKARYPDRDFTHIGDSYACDILGSHRAGMQGILIENAGQLPGILSMFPA